MKPRTLLTIALLGFVAASLAAMIVNETRRRPSPATSSDVPGHPSPVGTKLVAYYLHGNVRCATCRGIEQSAKQAIEAGFGPELRSGRLEWQVVNYEAPGNEHFATDYELVAPSVVLVSLRSGRRVAWTDLSEVWSLIDDRPAFTRLIQQSVRSHLDQIVSAP